MAYSLKVIGFSKSPKKIASSDSPITSGASAMYFSSRSSDLVTNETFTNSDLNWAVIVNQGYAEFEFTADSSGSDGQGLMIPTGFKEVKVTSVTGTVKRLPYLDVNYGHTKATAYSDGNAISVTVNDTLSPGDYLVCSKSSKFQVKFTAEDATFNVRPFFPLPIGLLVDSAR